jgi:hypothetical protein
MLPGEYLLSMLDWLEATNRDLKILSSKPASNQPASDIYSNAKILKIDKLK